MDHTDEPAAASRSRRRIFLTVGLILLGAALWRGTLAVQMPCISRDGAKFCAYARALGESGSAALWAEEFEQHPLFPAVILAARQLFVLCGAEDSPMTWQHAGQAVAWLSGLVVIALVGVLATRLVRALKLPVDETRAVLFATLLAALLPLSARVSADVLSEQLHLAFYLGGAACLIGLARFPAALGCGVLSGLAFLTRPEGAVVVVAGLLVLALQWRTMPKGRLVGLAAVVVSGFLVCAAPYWAAAGKFSPKMDKETVERWTGSASERTETVRLVLRTPNSRGEIRYAALIRHDYAWYEAVWRAAYETIRGGRIILPLLALFPLLKLRRRFMTPPLLGVVACMAAHFALTTYLVFHHGYLVPRHTIVVVVLLIPFSGMLLARLWILAVQHRKRTWGAMVISGCCLPLALYALRMPNGIDGFVARSAAWLTENDPQVRGKLLLGGSSQRRVAFYAQMRLQPWPENEPDPERRYAKLREHVLHNRPDYFAIETGLGDEVQGNDVLLRRLREEAELRHRMREVHVEHSEKEVTLHLFSLDWSNG